MDVQVLHNGTDITTYVTGYTREQFICSMTGIFDVQIARTCPRTFNPGDTIVLYEGGVKKGTYNSSIVSNEAPGSFFTLNCQDGSKRMQDYFISTSYTVNYPSNTKYWISKFLTEAQVSYTYDVAGSGQLLSNNTGLGMQTCYEQVTQLLQMSGWYLYFDADNVAHINALSRDVDDIEEELDRTDILKIQVMKHDQMLRNRAVVWGTGDPTTGAWVFANLQTITRWNYGTKDLRAVVVSNSSIPNVATAYTMAKKLLNEFARITVEKELEVHGARDLVIGDFVYVDTNIYNGSGLITSIGSTLSTDGLITNIILDQRCPRLFGYFDWGDYVYVSTWGSGVWRKHIDYDHTWYNYSTGLIELKISDLYKNNNLLSCVTESGDAYYSKDFIGSWYKIPGTSSAQSVMSSGVNGVEYATFSGVKVRGVVQEWSTNRIRMAADTRIQSNTQDFTATPFVATGMFNSFEDVGLGGTRAWVLDYSPGGPVNQYPVNVNGEYGFAVYSIANDGSNDFVSALRPTDMMGTQVVDGQQVGGYAENQQLDVTSSGPNYSQFAVYSGYGNGKADFVVTNMTFTHGEAVATYDEADFKGCAYAYNSNARMVHFVVASGVISNLQSHSVAMTYDEVFAICRIDNHTYRYLTGYDHTVYMYTVDFTAGTKSLNFSYTLNSTQGSYSGRWFTGTRVYPMVYSDSKGVTNFYVEEEYQNSLPRCRNIYYMTYIGNMTSGGVGSYTAFAVRFNLESATYDTVTFDGASGFEDYDGTRYSYQLIEQSYGLNIGGLLSRYGDYGPCFTYLTMFIMSVPCAVHPPNYKYVKVEGYVKFAFGNGFSTSTLKQFGATATTDEHVGASSFLQPSYMKTKNSYYNIFGAAFDALGISDNYLAAYPYSYHDYTTEENYDLEHEWRMDTGTEKATSCIVYYDSKYQIRDNVTGQMTPFTFPSWFDPWLVCVHVDEYTGNYYFYGRENNQLYAYEGLMEMDSSGNAVKWNAFYQGARTNPYDGLRDYCYLNGNFIVFEGHSHLDVGQVHNERWFSREVMYVVHLETKPIKGAGGGLILRRDNTTFTVVYSGGPAKLEISQSYPMVVIGSGATGTYLLDSFVVSPSGMFNAVPLPITPGGSVQDGRYANFTNSMTSEDFYKKLLVTLSGTIKMADITTLATTPTYQDYYTTASGALDQIEVTNFKLPDQYVFVSSPAVPPTFLQKNPTVSGISLFSGISFVDHSSGLPSAHITRIRTDDKI